MRKENRPASLTGRDMRTLSKTSADRARPRERRVLPQKFSSLQKQNGAGELSASQHRAHRGAHARSSQVGLPHSDRGEHPHMIKQACCLLLVLLSNTVLKSNKTGKRNKGIKIPKKEVKHSQT